MRLEDFVAARQPRWLELETLIRRSRRGRLRGMASTEMERFGLLYRHAASDLAIARRDFPEETVTVYLNGMCAQAQPLLARGEPARLADIPRFYVAGLPRLFRRAWPYILLSLGVTAAAAVAGYLAVELRPDLRASLVGQSLFDLLARGEIKDIPDPVAGSWVIILNNVFVAMICLLGGMLVGIPTAIAMFQNGWMLGTIAAAVHIGGYDTTFWSSIVPHGIVEISVIVVAGGAGFMIAGAVIRPGSRPRGEIIAETSKDALKLAGGMATLLIICGVIEGFVSPSPLGPATKVAIGVSYAALVYAWLLIGGRSQKLRPALSYDQVGAQR